MARAFVVNMCGEKWGSRAKETVSSDFFLSFFLSEDRRFGVPVGLDLIGKFCCFEF